MKKTLVIVLIIALLIGTLFILTGCGAQSNGKNSIIGSWKNESSGTEFIYTFNEDGTGNYNVNGTNMEFTYKTDGDKISILYNGDTVSFDTEYKVDGDTLNVVDSFGEDTLYQKIK